MVLSSFLISLVLASSTTVSLCPFVVLEMSLALAFEVMLLSLSEFLQSTTSSAHLESLGSSEGVGADEDNEGEEDEDEDEDAVRLVGAPPLLPSC